MYAKQSICHNYTKNEHNMFLITIVSMELNVYQMLELIMISLMYLWN